MARFARGSGISPPLGVFAIPPAAAGFSVFVRLWSGYVLQAIHSFVPASLLRKGGQGICGTLEFAVSGGEPRSSPPVTQGFELLELLLGALRTATRLLRYKAGRCASVPAREKCRICGFSGRDFWFLRKSTLCQFDRLCGSL